MGNISTMIFQALIDHATFVNAHDFDIIPLYSYLQQAYQVTGRKVVGCVAFAVDMAA